MPADLWIRGLVVTSYETNCYLVGADRHVAVVDPGGDADHILDLLESENRTLTAIVNTHGHGDHIGANAVLKEHFDCPVLIHEADAAFLTDPGVNLSAYLGTEPVVSTPADRLLREGDEVRMGPISFRVIHTPGHTPGGICLYADGHLFSGDTLFAGSVGRTDFPGGSMEQLFEGIRDKLLTLPNDTIVYPGHGPATTIGDEKVLHQSFYA